MYSAWLETFQFKKDWVKILVIYYNLFKIVKWDFITSVRSLENNLRLHTPQFKKMLDFLGDTFLMTRLAKQAGFQCTAGTGRRE